MAIKVKVIIKKEELEKNQIRIDNIINNEKANSDKFRFLPDYVKSLYEMYLETGINIANFYENLLTKNKTNLNIKFEIYKNFIINYITNTHRFKNDLNRLLSMMGLQFENEKNSQPSNEKFLYQVLEDKVEDIYLIDTEYNKKEKAISSHFKKRMKTKKK